MSLNAGPREPHCPQAPKSLEVGAQPASGALAAFLGAGLGDTVPATEGPPGVVEHTQQES